MTAMVDDDDDNDNDDDETAMYYLVGPDDNGGDGSWGGDVIGYGFLVYYSIIVIAFVVSLSLSLPV